MNIAIEGMHCDACVARVRKALEKVEGAKVKRVEVGSAEVDLDPKNEDKALQAVSKAGYQPHKA